MLGLKILTKYWIYFIIYFYFILFLNKQDLSHDIKQSNATNLHFYNNLRPEDDKHVGNMQPYLT